MDQLKKNIIIIILITGFFSCNQSNLTTSRKIIDDTKIVESTEIFKNPEEHSDDVEEYIDTEYIYLDTIGKGLIIQNSFPKGGLEYVDPTGKNYVYAVFWTRIINQANVPFEISIEIPTTSFELLSSPDNYFKIILPTKKMSIDKVSLFNYGLTELDFMINPNLQRLTSLQETIHPKSTSSFYVVTSFSKGLKGVVRAGLSIRDEHFFYRINDTDIHIGQLNIKKQN